MPSDKWVFDVDGDIFNKNMTEYYKANAKLHRELFLSDIRFGADQVGRQLHVLETILNLLTNCPLMGSKYAIIKFYFTGSFNTILCFSKLCSLYAKFEFNKPFTSPMSNSECYLLLANKRQPTPMLPNEVYEAIGPIFDESLNLYRYIDSVGFKVDWDKYDKFPDKFGEWHANGGRTG